MVVNDFEELLDDKLGLVVVQDSLQLSGLFLIPQLLRMLLKRDCKVVLVHIEQCLEKYKYVLKKLGVNLAQHIDSGNVVAVTLTAGRDSLNMEDSGIQVQSWCQAITAAAQQLVDASVRQASCLELAVLVDGASLLAGIQPPGMMWQGFLQYLHCLGDTLQAPLYTCVMLAHADVEDDSPWITALHHWADVVLEVLPLVGDIADIRGQVVIEDRTLRSRAAEVALMTGQGAAEVSGLMSASAVSPKVRLYFRVHEAHIRWRRSLAATTSDLM